MLSVVLWMQAGFSQEAVELVPPERGYVMPGDTYRFAMPSGFSVARLKSLRLEMDAIDVTAFVQSDGSGVVFTPPQLLAYGLHEFRLVEVDANGSITELGLWTVDVRKSAAFREADASADLNLSGQRLVDQENVSSELSRLHSDGSLRMRAHVADNEWQASAATDLLYDSSAVGRRVDLAGGLAEIGNRTITIKAGDHSVGSGNFILNNLARRGMSVSANLAALRTDASAFAMRSDSVSGFRGGLGIEDSDNRTVGLMVSSSLFAKHPDRLRISTTYLNATGSALGASTIGDSEDKSSSALSMVADSIVWNGRIHARAQVAHTRLNFPTSTDELKKFSDGAYGVSLTYSHPVQEKRGQPLSWNVGMERRSVGMDFFSLGNPGLPADNAISQIFGDISWGGWSLNAQAARENDNTDDDPAFPTQRADSYRFAGAYSPLSAIQAEGFWRAFALSNLSLAAQVSDQSFDKLPVSWGGVDVDQMLHQVSVIATFSPMPWTWSIGYSRSQFDDRTRLQHDYTEDMTEFSLDLPIGTRASIGPNLQYIRRRDRVDASRTTVLSGGIAAQFSFIADRLTGNLNYSLSRGTSSDMVAEYDSYTMAGTLNWVMRRATTNHPGLAMYLNGNYYRDRDQPFSTAGRYQMFLGLRFGWSLAH